MGIVSILAKMSKAKKALLKTNNISKSAIPSYYNSISDVADFNTIIAKDLTRKTILPHEQMTFSLLRDRYETALDAIKESSLKINKGEFLSKKEIEKIKSGKKKLKDFYKSDDWQLRAEKAGLTKEEVKATSDFLCDNVDRTIISGNPLSAEMGAYGTSSVYSGYSFGTPVVYYERGASDNTIIHELAHASEFNSFDPNFIYKYAPIAKHDIRYYKNIDPKALDGLLKLKDAGNKLSSEASKGFEPEFMKDYNGPPSKDKDYLLYVVKQSELRADRIASLLTEPSDRKYLFTPETNKSIDENIFTAAPTIGIVGLSAYDMLNNNL